MNRHRLASNVAGHDRGVRRLGKTGHAEEEARIGGAEG